MKVIRKVNLNLLLTLCVVCISMLHPMTARAEGNVLGGKGNTVKFSETTIYAVGTTVKTVRTADIVAKEDVEIIGRLQDYGTGYVSIGLYYVKDGKWGSLTENYCSDYVGVQLGYDNDGKLISSSSSFYSSFYISSYDDTAQFFTSYSGFKVFDSLESVNAYVENGSLDGMIKGEDDVDSGTYDSEIGYLHNLKYQGMMYGERDENGFYESNDDRYTWSDYYPEYDDSYLVEVRASCEVEVKKWFGFGQSNEYKSRIRLLDTGVSYKDLEYILSLEHQKDVFGDFINEYMPELGATVGSWWLDTLYFRIYRWDEKTESFKYGKWVRLERQGSALNPSGDFVTDYGDLNKDGTWKQDTDSDYGKGKKGQRVVGSGADQESAKNDVNKKQENQDNGGIQIDFSNTNFAELWEWFTGVLLSFWNGLGVIPDFFGRLFSFLPSPVIGFLGLGIVVAIILRVVGR